MSTTTFNKCQFNTFSTFKIVLLLLLSHLNGSNTIVRNGLSIAKIIAEPLLNMDNLTTTQAVDVMHNVLHEMETSVRCVPKVQYDKRTHMERLSNISNASCN